MQTDLQRELLDLENQFWQCMKDKNIDRALELTNDLLGGTGRPMAASIHANPPPARPTPQESDASVA